MSSHLKKVLTLVVSFSASTGVANAALIVPEGLAPGETYQLAFVTSGTTAATSTDIDYYNTLVQSAANAAGMGGITWTVIGSTATVNANANALVTGKVFNMNGELVASNYADFWDGTHTLGVGIDYDENNNARNFNVWTGSTTSGASSSTAALGNATVVWGESTFANSGWIARDTNNATVNYALYALSAPLTAPVPVPAAVWLFGSGMAALLAIGRRSRHR